MKHDLSGLAATLLSNRITVRFTTPHTPSTIPEADADYRRQCQRMIVRLHLGNIRMGLSAAGQNQWFDNIAFNGDGECLLHLFFIDREAMLSVSEHTQGIVGPSELGDREATVFIEHRLEKLPLSVRDPWWACDFS
jgi:hypothetical protein